MTETVKERYIREARRRMAARMGENLTEELFSVAADTHLDVVNVAELMAAAYKMGVHAVLHGELPVICENGCPEGFTGRHKMSCPEARKRYEQERDEIPDADPANKELRLLRAIYGLCPDCDIREKHSHDSNPETRVSGPTYPYDAFDDEPDWGGMKCHACGEPVEQDYDGTWFHPFEFPEDGHYPEPYIPIEELEEITDDDRLEGS